MTEKKLKSPLLAHVMSVALGLLLLMTVLVAFLRFAKGNITVALCLALIATLLLSLFLSWLDIEETKKDSEKEKNSKFRYLMRGR